MRLYEFAVGHSLVGAQEYALLLVPGCCPVQRAGERGAVNLIIIQRNAQVRLEREKQRLVGPRCSFGTGGRKVDGNVHCRQRRRNHEDDQQYQNHVDERRDVDLVDLA